MKEGFELSCRVETYLYAVVRRLWLKELRIAGVDQAGLGLPDRDYYLKNEGKMPEIRKLYQAHIASMLVLLGDRKAAAQRAAKAVMKMDDEEAS